MKAAICEDEPAQAAETARLLQEWAARHGEPAALSVFPSAEALRFRWEEEQDWDLLVLDIQMPGENGMDLARALRAGGFRGAILFLTAVPDFMAQGYDVEALHYLLKPVEPEKLFACLDRACRRAGRAYTLLVSDPKGAAVRIDQKEIRFLRVRAHTQRSTVSGLYFFSGSLDAAEKELASGAFARCHRSCIAGLRFVQTLERDRVVLEDGTCLPVSRRLFQSVRAAFVAYYQNGEGLS